MKKKIKQIRYIYFVFLKTPHISSERKYKTLVLFKRIFEELQVESIEPAHTNTQSATQLNQVTCCCALSTQCGRPDQPPTVTALVHLHLRAISNLCLATTGGNGDKGRPCSECRQISRLQYIAWLTRWVLQRHLHSI